MDLYCAYPIVKVFSEFTIFYEPFKILVGGTYQSKIAVYFFSAPKPPYFFSCNTLKSLGCKCKGKSPISSKKRTPPLADSISPSLLDIAPVKAPFSYPKSSASSSSEGTAEQFIATKGPFHLLDVFHNAFAKTSFPTPVSPTKRTGTSREAALPTFKSASLILPSGFPTMEQSSLHSSPEISSSCLWMYMILWTFWEPFNLAFRCL